MELSKLLNGVKPQEDQNGEKKALPQGKYVVKIEKVEPKTNATTGNKGLNLQLRVVGEKYSNYVVFDYMGLTGSEKQLSYSLPKLKKLGLTLDSEDTNKWLGRAVTVSVSVDNQDATRNIVWGYGQADEALLNGQAPVANGLATITNTDIPF